MVDQAAVPRATLGRGVMPAIMLSLIAVVSAVSSLNLAAASVAQDLKATQTQIAWIVDAYALVFAALLLLAGAMGDRYGRRLALVAGLSVFSLGAILAMLVDGPEQLIAAQAVLGIGAALVMPATLSTITATFPPDKRVRAVGTWAGVSGASAMLGLLACGLLLEVWSWRSVFAFNLAMGVLALLLTLRFVPESADPSAPRLDVVGAGLSVVALGLLVYSIIEAPTEGWTASRTLAGIAAGLVALAGFMAWEFTRSEPLLDPRLFTLRGFAAGSLTVTMQFFGFFGFVFLVAQYLQLVIGYSALVSAVAVAPLGVAMMPSARAIAPRAAAKVGTMKVVILGLLLLAGGFLILAQLEAASSYWLLLAGLIVLGVGMGLAMTPSTSAITDALPVAKQGVGSAVNDLARELGAALGIAVLGSIMLSAYRNQLDAAGLPPAVVEQARSSLGLATHMGGQVATEAQAAFTIGMHNALLWAAGLLTMTALGVAALLRGRDEYPASPLGPADDELSAAARE